MGVHWKSKQTQKNLLGKSTLAHQSSNISPVIQCVSTECKVSIIVYQDAEVTAEHEVIIKGVAYTHGTVAYLAKGDYVLTWQPRNTAYFYMWKVVDNVSVADEYATSTTLTVSCGGTLTLNLRSLPAFNYDNLVGAIWMEDPGKSGYDNAPTGQIEVSEPSGQNALNESQGGYYDDRT